jgi:hypothetical protein
VCFLGSDDLVRWQVLACHFRDHLKWQYSFYQILGTFCFKWKSLLELGVVEHICNPSTLEAEAEGT